MIVPPSLRSSLVRGCVCVALLAGAATLPAAAAANETPGPSLEEQERAIAAQFGRLEDSLLKLARFLRKTEPERSELLVRALQKAREERIEVRMESIADLLRSDAAAGLAPNFGDAIEEQVRLIEGLRNVLGLLRSEDRRKEIDSEQARLAALLKDVKRLESEQKAAEAAARRGDAAPRVAGKQRDVADRTGELLDEIDRDDARRAAGDENDGENGEEEAGDAESESGDPADGDPADGGAQKPSDPNGGEPGESDPGESGDPGEEPEPKEEPRPGDPPEPGDMPPGETPESETPPGESDAPPTPGAPGSPPQPGESGEPPPDSPPPGEQPQGERTPGKQELEEAKQAMEDALKELEEAKREGAREKQAEAIQKLAEAKEKLEEILRQLREEEAELVLRALEVRFQKMLAMQQAVLTDTLSLAATPELTDKKRAKARELSRSELAIGLEGAKALQLLREDGSSVAFPEALEQINSDIAFVAQLLGEKVRFDELTQQVQRDVIESLEELIDALQQELERLQQKKEGEQGQPQQGQPGEQGLVDTISELKMLRTLQKGVNRRTRLLSLEVPAAGQAADVDVADRLRDLSNRQSRIEGATYDLAIGKTQ